MPKYTVAPELRERLADPIEFELKGQTFSLAVIPTHVYAELGKLGDDSGADAIDRILALLIGPERYEGLKPVDGREALPLITWLSGQLTAGLPDTEKKTVKPSPV